LVHFTVWCALFQVPFLCCSQCYFDCVPRAITLVVFCCYFVIGGGGVVWFFLTVLRFQLGLTLPW
jgi:hypothetical protein